MPYDAFGSTDVPPLGPLSLERVEQAWHIVQARVLKAAAALEKAGVPYAIAGGNAVALWVSRVDVAAVRATQDVHILVRRSDFDAVKIALEAVGFVYRHIANIDAFLEPPGGRVRDAVHIVFANEKVREHEPAANPDVDESEQTDQFRVLSLQALVQIKLTAFRRKDQVHLLDMIDVGLLDESWLDRLPAPLAERLKTLLNDPNG